jgi:chaperonin GroES
MLAVFSTPKARVPNTAIFLLLVNYFLRRNLYMKLIPLADRVVLKQVKAEEKTKSGLILSSAAQEKPEIFEVVEVGPGGMVDGKEVVMTVQVGQKVITGKYTGTNVKIDGEELLIVKQAEILAIVAE